MSKRIGWGVAVIAAVLLTWAAVQASESTWVQADGTAHVIAGHDAIFISEEGGEAFNLNQLAEGETRIFGTGTKQVTVTRSGDIATIEHTEAGEEDTVTIECLLTSDSCQIMTFADDPEKIMVMISKERECVDGEGDCDDLDVVMAGLGDLSGNEHVVIRRIECDDDGNCEEFEDVHQGAGVHGAHEGIVRIERLGDGDEKQIHVRRIGEHGDAMANVMVLAGEPGAEMIFTGAMDKVTLRCPEGDATLTVDKAEADDVFLCPKHSVPMEKLSTPHGHGYKYRVKKSGDDN